jgi:hypothetical protein
MGFRIRSYKFERRVLTLIALQTARRKVADSHTARINSSVLCKANLISLIDCSAFFKPVASTVPVWMEQHKRSEIGSNFINRMTFKHKLNMNWIWGSHSGNYKEGGLLDRRFEGTFQLYLQDRIVSQRRNKQNQAASKAYVSTLIMEAVCSSETSGSPNYTTLQRTGYVLNLNYFF